MPDVPSPGSTLEKIAKEAASGNAAGVSGESSQASVAETTVESQPADTALQTWASSAEQAITITEETSLPAVPTASHNARIKRILTPLSVEKIETFLITLQKTGRKADSALKAGIELSTINRLIKTDREFGNMYEERMELFRNRLERECYQRAVVGWDEPVFNKAGDIAGHVRRKDGKLLEFMMKRHIPEYKDKIEVSAVHSGGVLVIPARAENADDWLRQNSTAANRNLLSSTEGQTNNNVDVIDVVPEAPSKTTEGAG